MTARTFLVNKTTERGILTEGTGERIMATVEARVTALETEFRTELRQIANKADLIELESRLRSEIVTQTRWMVGGLIATVGIVVTLQRFWA